MAWRVRGGELPLSRTLVDPELHYGQISTTEAFSEEECSQQDAVQRMVPVAGSPIIMCGTSGCSGSCSVSAVENGYEAGKKPATCQTCEKIFPCPNSRNASPVTSRRSRNTSPAMSRRSSVVSWSDSPRDQAVSKSVEAVMGDCTESHQIWNDTLGEQSRNQVGTTVPAAMGPCAPSEPVLHSSGFADASEHAAISGCVETRVECTVSHGLGKSGGHGTIRTLPVHLGLQFAQVGYLGVESVPVISGLYAESSAVVQGKSCVDRAVPHGVDVAMSGGSCGKGTSPAHLARSQPGVSTQCAHVGYPGVELVSRATYISRKKRNLETVQRQSKALKKAQRDAKRKSVAQPEISHEAAELILRNQAARTDGKFPSTIHVSHHLA